jgi:uncharacterized protein involved in response to NO
MVKLESARPQPMQATAAFALWNLGFRPFYFLASVFAALSVALWTCEYAGYLSAGYLRVPVWHGHEMLFGYTLAVVTGFLFTAVRNWTGQPTPTGALLAAYAALWVAGRVLVLTPYALTAALVNAAFPLAGPSASAFRSFAAAIDAITFLIAFGGAWPATLAAHLLSWACCSGHSSSACKSALTSCCSSWRYGRARHSDVHQQWRPGRPGQRHPLVEKLAWRRSRLVRG